jgi:hypothetical protein
MAEDLTDEEISSNYETMKHIDTVQKCINIVITELIKRGEQHDATKLEDPELGQFAELTPKLSSATYGSEEYKQFLEELKPTLAHHYSRNRHHPEHHKNGVDDMTIVDLIEMLCDWKAATLRSHDGNLKKSIDHNMERFGLSEQLTKILENSIDLFDDIKE